MDDPGPQSFDIPAHKTYQITLQTSRCYDMWVKWNVTVHGSHDWTYILTFNHNQETHYNVWAWWTNFNTNVYPNAPNAGLANDAFCPYDKNNNNWKDCFRDNWVEQDESGMRPTNTVQFGSWPW
jgi:hypothetical protein